MGMAELFAGGHLRFINGAWRDDNGDPVEIAEVVRCKDCRHWIERTANGIDTFHVCWFNGSITGRNHFCVYGEKKADED